MDVRISALGVTDRSAIAPVVLTFGWADAGLRRCLRARTADALPPGGPSRICDIMGIMPLDRASLLSHLVEHLQFMDASCAMFDAGSSIESKRLALSLRVLLHDTSKSSSLLGQLGVKDEMAWPSNLLDVTPPDGSITHHVSTPGLAVMGVPQGSMAPVWVPFYETHPIDMSRSAPSFDDWWARSITMNFEGQNFSRRNFVLTVTNKDGGAHVDGSGLPKDFEALTTGSLGWMVNNKPFLDSPVPAALRHIAEETRFAVRHYFMSELGAAEPMPASTAPDRGEMMFLGGFQMSRIH